MVMIIAGNLHVSVASTNFAYKTFTDCNTIANLMFPAITSTSTTSAMKGNYVLEQQASTEW